MQKLSTATARLANRGSQLIDSASAAVAQGTQLSSVVASRANAVAEEVVAQVRSPEKRRSRGGARASGGGRGIRDRINKFDSVSKSNVGHRSTAPFPRRKSGGGGRTGRGRGRSGGGHESTVPPVPPPCHPNFCEKENETNREPSDRSLFSKEGEKNLTPALRRKKNRRSREEAASHPMNPRYRENETESATRDGRKRNEIETESNQSRESRSGHDRGQEGDRRAVDEGMDLAQLNRAAVMGRSRTNDSKKHANASYGVPRSKKRGKADHPLIASPLRKHIRGVHDSACGNAACTIPKDPFPLLPPACTDPLAVVANWEGGKSCNESGESKGDMGHLDTLGSVMGAWKGGGIGLRRGGGAADGVGSGGDGGKKEGEEAALDLLSSAVFMFKHSRRNLG